MKVLQRKGAGSRIEVKMVGENVRIACMAIFKKKDCSLNIVGSDLMIKKVLQKFSCFQSSDVVKAEKYYQIEKQGVNFAGKDREEAINMLINAFSKLDTKSREV